MTGPASYSGKEKMPKVKKRRTCLQSIRSDFPEKKKKKGGEEKKRLSWAPKENNLKP